MAQVITLSNGFNGNGDKLDNNAIINDVSEVKIEIDSNDKITYFFTFYLNAAFESALALTNWEVVKERFNTLTTFYEPGKGIAIVSKFNFATISIEKQTRY